MCIGFRRGLQTCSFQLGQHKAIHRRLHPGFVLHDRLRHALRLDQRPVRLPWGTLGDPLLHQGNLRRLQFLVRLRRRHDLILVLGKKPLKQTALVRLAFDHRRLLILFGSEETSLGVES